MPPGVSSPDPRVSVVIATRDRVSALLETIARLQDLPEKPPVVVVDNASTDGTAREVRRRHPDVVVVELPVNRGAAARTVGVERVTTPYVAFSDDDSWWAPGSLHFAADVLDRHPHLGLVAARVLVGPDERLDPTCHEMATSPLPGEDLPGPAVLGFIACGAVVRRKAYLEAGGFDEHFGVGGEEELLALDLARRGWSLAYVDAVVAHHHPHPVRDPSRRTTTVVRNALWCTWLRRPLPAALRRSGRLVRDAMTTPEARAGVSEALRGAPWVLGARRVIPAELERGVRALETAARLRLGRDSAGAPLRPPRSPVDRGA